MAVGTGPTEAEPFDVKVQWRKDGKLNQFGFSLRRSLAAFATPADIAEDVRTTIQEPLLFLLPPDAQFLGVDVTHALDKTGAGVSPNNAVGGSAVSMGPSFVAAVVSLKGERRTRYGQGRFFLPVYFEQSTDGNTLSTSGQTLLNAVLDPLRARYITGGEANGLVMINWHKLLPANRPTKNPGSLTEVPATSYDVKTMRLNPVVTSLRSRKVNVGS